MASSAAFTSSKLLCLFIIMGLAVPNMASIDYYVCDSLGWTTVAITTITQWLNPKRFLVNDVIHFVSSNPARPVYLVSAEAFATCNATAAVFTDVSGNCAYTLTEPGTYHFISSFVECVLGLKIAITANSV